MPPMAGPAHSVLTELKWVHARIRQDLRALQDLAKDVSAGAPAADVRSRVQNLQTRGPLFQLKVNCLQACGFVHHHHSAESVMLFPAVRRADPRLASAVDRLEDDHRKVSDLAD